jgi:hypothetical protein
MPCPARLLPGEARRSAESSHDASYCYGRSVHGQVGVPSTDFSLSFAMTNLTYACVR